MKRNSDLTVTISKSGCKTIRVNVTNQVANAGAASMAGNLVLGGVVGAGVDAYTGASMELVPNPLDVDLDCN